MVFRVWAENEVEVLKSSIKRTSKRDKEKQMSQRRIIQQQIKLLLILTRQSVTVTFIHWHIYKMVVSYTRASRTPRRARDKNINTDAAVRIKTG